MDGASPFGILTVVPDELRQFAALAPLATITPVSGSVSATPPLSGAMPESQAPDTHVKFSVEQTATVTLNAAQGIETLIQAALSFASAFESTDQANADIQQKLAMQLSGSGFDRALVAEGGDPGNWKDSNQTLLPTAREGSDQSNPFPRNCWDRSADEPSAQV